MDQDSETSKKSNGHQEIQVNGVTNGFSGDKHHKSSHKDKHRDKDRDHRKEHKSSSSSKDKEKHSSSKDKERSKDHKSSSRDKEKERGKERSDKEKSDRDKDRHRSDKDRHHDDRKSSSSKDYKSTSSSSKDKDKEHKSSSSSHDKDKHRHSSSSKDKHNSSSKDKDKSKSSSSSSKHHSSSSRDKDRKDRDKSRSDKPKLESGDSERRKSEKSAIVDVPPVVEPAGHFGIKEEDEQQGSSYANLGPDPNISAASSCDYNLSAFNKTEPEFENTDVKEEDNDEEEAECYNSVDEQPQYDEIKQEVDSQSDDDVALASRAITPTTKRKIESDDDDTPLVARKKIKKEKKDKKTKKRAVIEEEEEFETKPKKTKIKKEIKQEQSANDSASPKKRKKKEEAEPEVWKWWEEEKKDDGTKWHFLEHKGPVFAPPYDPLPDKVRFYYDGKEIKLSQDAEEVAGFYAKMLDHDYTTKDVFNNNFFKDWRKVMNEKERSTITDLKKCNFKEMQAYFLDLSEKNRNKSKEEKEELKKKNAAIQEEYGFCTIDGHKEKIGNFRIEPPGLFRGRGEHPKMGMLKKRVLPEDVLINCAKKSLIPKPPAGHKWKEVRHDPNVTWLASWTENVQNQVKYVMLNPSSKLKGEKDWQKYETARKLAKSIDKIRKEYREDWKSKEMRIRQRAVALYFIDKLALRAGNEKDEDQADTVGCCSLRVEHIALHEEKDGKEFVVVFDFLGKDSIRYYNEVPVEKRVFKNLQLFMENKAPSDDLFDRLNTAVMNKHLNELMEGLTAKVFRTYNASWTLQQQLDELTDPDDSVAEKILSYNRANRAVAILCNHQRSVPKGHAKSMEKLKEKIDQKREQISDGEAQVKDAKRSAKGGSVKEQVLYDKKKKMLERLRDQLKKLEVQETDRDENKAIALGTSKLNYLDPRISVAWCKKYDVPIEKIYNKTQRDKFRWAIDMAGADYVF